MNNYLINFKQIVFVDTAKSNDTGGVITDNSLVYTMN